MKMTTSSADGERQEAMRTAVRGRLLRERSVQALRWRGATVAIVAASLAGVAAPMVAAAAPAPAPALTTGVRELDYGTHFNATGIEDSRLRFAYTRFSEVDGKGVIHLGITKWAEGPAGWGTDPANEFAGKYILSFSNKAFFTQIESIQLTTNSKAKLAMQPGTDGAMWTLEINAANLATGTVGAVTNHDLAITLKGGQTLESLGLAQTGLDFESVWIMRNGAIAEESISSGFILGANPLNKAEHDTGFMAGRMGNNIIVDAKGKRVLSVHTFKPNVQFITTDLQWVVYVKEQIPAELRDYLDVDDVKLYNSTILGELRNQSAKTFTTSVDEQGMVDTSRVPELSIMQKNDAAQRKVARDNIGNLFGTVTGQEVNYTISYKIKDGVSIADFSRALNDYMTQHDARVRFQSWMESDYLDNEGTRKDNGAPHRQLTGSYANAYLQTNDTDKDGVFDFVEFEHGMQIRDVDTDGDGVPDGQELLDDATDPTDPKSYLVVAPTTAAQVISPAMREVITGAMPKALITDPSDAGKKLVVRSVDAGDAVVRLVRATKADGAITPDVDQVYATYKIPFVELEAGTFSLPVEAGMIPEGVDTVVLVGTSPDGKNLAVGSAIAVSRHSEHFDPKPQAVQVALNAKVPDAVDGIANTKDMPVGTTYAWKQTPSTAAAGTSKQIVVVTYPDTSTDEVEVDFTVADARKDNERYEPQGKPVQVKLNDPAPAPQSAIANMSDLPQQATFAWETEPKTDVAGVVNAAVVVTYQDGSTDRVPVQVTVIDPRTEAAKHTPQPHELTTEMGTVPQATAGVANKDELPAGTKIDWATAPDVSHPGDVTGVIVVTYPDGSQDVLTTPITVTDSRQDVEKYAPRPKPIDVELGKKPQAESGIANRDELPPNTTITWKTEPDTSAEGDVAGVITVTYPDGTHEDIDVTVHVRDPRPLADRFEPTASPIQAEMGAAPNAAAGVANKGELPAGTKIDWATAPDTSRPGDVTGVIVVTYPDGSKDVLTVPVHVVDSRKDAEKYAPVGQEVTTTEGVVPPATNGIANMGDLPKDAQVAWKDAPDVSAPGTHAGVITVTYPDGTTDEVSVDITVQPKPVDPQNMAYTPVGAPVRVELGGHAPDAKSAIANTGELPQDAQYLWKTFPSVDAAGEFTGSVVVAYADGTFDVVDVAVTVVDTRTMADVHTPQPGDVTVEVGKQPNAEDGIANLDELPAGTQVEWQTEPDTSGAGDTVGTIVVTYPDGSHDTVDVPVHVNKPDNGDGNGGATDNGGSDGNGGTDGNGGATDNGNDGGTTGNGDGNGSGNGNGSTDGTTGGSGNGAGNGGTGATGNNAGAAGDAGRAPAKDARTTLPQTGDTASLGVVATLASGVSALMVALGLSRRHQR